jgi:hypothetical protein
MSDQNSLPAADSAPCEQSPPATPTPGVHNPDRSVCTFDSFECEADGHVFRATWPSHVTDPSIAVVSALAVVTDTDPMAVGPLHDAVDTDALDTLLTRGPVGGSGVSIAFSVAGHEVTVNTGGTLSVRPPQADDS